VRFPVDAGGPFGSRRSRAGVRQRESTAIMQRRARGRSSREIDVFEADGYDVGDVWC
jgi:hypothetical protein